MVSIVRNYTAKWHPDATENKGSPVPVCDAYTAHPDCGDQFTISRERGARKLFEECPGKVAHHHISLKKLDGGDYMFAVIKLCESEYQCSLCKGIEAGAVPRECLRMHIYPDDGTEPGKLVKFIPSDSSIVLEVESRANNNGFSKIRIYAEINGFTRDDAVAGIVWIAGFRDIHGETKLFVNDQNELCVSDYEYRMPGCV